MLKFILIMSLLPIALIVVIEKFNLKLGIQGDNYVVVFPKDNAFKIYNFLYLKIDYEKLVLATDSKFKNRVFEHGFNIIQKIQFDKNMLCICLNEYKQFKFEVSKLNSKMLERMLVQLQEYKNGINA